MSKEIDERVVSMQFDNALFEKNIQKSLKSVDDLNKSLNNLDGAKGFNELNKAAKKVDLSPIMDSAKEVEKSFSKMEIVSTGALLRIGSELTEFGIKIGKKFWDSTIGQIKSGGWKRASDIKSGKFMLEGLGLTDSQVKEMSKAAQDAVTDTAAGLGEAMKAAGVLATSGLKDAEKMRDTLRGIAGMSAMTGRSFENIANIYSTVASNGKLMTMQLRQFSFAGINVAAKLAEQMGTTEEAVNKMVTEGKIDFQTFSDAMTEAFGDHAKEANKTFSGALANMKAALSRIGENFATPLMDNLKDVFNNFRVFFNAVNKALAPVYKDFELLMKVGNKFIEDIFNPIIKKDDKGNLDTYSSAIDNIVEGIRNLYSTVLLIFKTIGEAFKEVFPSLEDSSEGFKNLTKSIMPTKQGLELLKTVLIPLFEILRVVGTAIKYVITFASYFIRVIAAVVHSLTGLSGGLTEWMKKAREGKSLATALENVFDILAAAIMGVGAAILSVLSLISKLVKKLGEFFKFDFDSIKQIGLNIISGICEGLEAGFGVLQKVWTTIVSFIPDTIKNALKIKSPSRVMISVGNNVMAGLVKGMSKGEDDLDKEVEETNNVFKKIVDFGILIADTLGKTAYAAIEGLISLFKKFTGKVDDANLKKTAATLVETKEVMNDVYMAGSPAAGTTTQVVKMGDDWVETNEEVEKSTESMGDKVTGFFDNISSKMKELGINIDAFKLILAGFGVALVATFTQAAFSLNLLSGLGRTIATLSVIAGAFLLLKNVDFTPMIEGIKSLFTNIKNFADNLNIVENIKRFFTTIREIVEENNMVMLAAKALAFTFAIVIIRTVHSLAVLATNISNSVATIAGAIKSLSNFKLGLYETSADKILKFAVAISVITVSLTLLAKAFSEDPTAMTNAVIVIGGLIALVMAYSLLINLISKKKGSTKVASEAVKELLMAAYSILGLVASVVLLCKAFDGLEAGTIIASFLTFAGVLLAFGIFVKRLDGTKVNLSPGTIAALSIFILAIGKMMYDFGKMLESTKDIDDLALAFTKMVAPILSALVGIALILKMIQKTYKTNTTKGKSGGLMGLIRGIVGDEDKMTNTDISDNAVKTLLSVSALLLTMSAVMKIFSTFNANEMKAAITGATVALAVLGTLFIIVQNSADSISAISGFARDFAIAVLSLTATATLLKNLNDAEFDLAFDRIVAITALVGAIVAVVAVFTRFIMRKAEPLVIQIKGLGLTLAAIAFGLAALGTVFSLIPEDRLKQFAKWSEAIVGYVLGVVIVISVLSMVMDLLNGIGDDAPKEKRINPFTNMMGMLLGIGMVMGALVVLSVLDPQSLIMPLISISAILILLTAMFAQIKNMKDIDNAKSIFTAIAVIITVLAASLTALSLLPLDTRQMGLAFAAMGIILLELIGLLAVIDNMTIDKSVLVTLGIMAGIITIIATIIGLLAAFGGDKALAASGAIGIVLGVTAAFMALCGVIGTFLPGAIGILGAFASIITALGVALLASGVGISLVLLTLSGALGVITVCLEALQKIDFDYVAAGLLKMAGATIAFGVAMSAMIVLIGGAVSLLAGFIADILVKLLPAFIVIGAMLMIGLNKGIKKESKKAAEAAVQAANGVTTATKDAFQEKSPSKLFRKIGQFLLDGLALGIVDKIPLVGNTIKEFVKNIADWFNGKADELESVGDDWGNAIKLGLSDALGDVDFEIPNITDELSELTQGLKDEGDAAEGAAVSTDKYTSSLSDATKGTDKLKDSIANALDMFSGFDDTANLTGKDVINSFQEQIRGVEKWRDELSTLSARGLGEVIIQELESLGPQAYEKVHAFYTMTNSELAMMNIMYKQKLALQNGTSKKIAKSFGKLTDDVTDELKDGIDEMGDILTGEVTDMASGMMDALKKQMDYEKVINQVTGFRDNIADKIRSSMSIFEAVNEQEEVKAEELLDNMKAQVKHVGKWATMITEMAGKGFSEGLVATLTEMGPQSYAKVAAFLTMSEDQIAEANRLYEASEQVPEYGADKIVKAFAEAGFTASMGLTDSFLEGLDPTAVEQALTDLANKSITTLQYEMDHPVSAWDIGNEWAGAFADGLHAALEDAKSQAKQDMQDIKDIVEETEEERAQRQMNAYNANRQYYDQRYINQLRESESNAEKEQRAAEAAEKAAYERSRDYAYSNQIHMNSTGPKKTYDTEMEYRNKYVKDRDFIYRTTEQSDEKFDELLKAYYGNRINEFVKENYQSIASLGGAKMKVNTEYDIYKMIQSGMMYDDNASVELKKYVNSIIDDAQGNIFEGYYTLGSGARKAMAEGMQEDQELGKAAIDAGNVTICGYTGQSFAGGGSGTLKAMNKDQMFNTPLGKGLIDLGGYSGEALAKGVNEQGSEYMSEAGANVAGSFIVSLRDNLFSLIEGILGSDDDVSSPKIKPVFDGTGFLDGVKSFLNKNPIDFSAAGTVNMAYKDRDTRVVDAINGISNQEVVDAVKDLANIVDLFRGQATNLQVVMDTGQTIGALGHPMDLYLGQQSKNAGRGM